MDHQIKYILFLLSSIPILPVLLIQAMRVRKKVAILPSAEGCQGKESGEKPTIRLLSLGESTFDGVGVATHREGITGSLASSLKVKTGRQISWQVIAKSGFTAQEATETLVPKIPEQGFDLIVLGIGANDAFARNSPLRWKKDLSDLLSAIRIVQPNAPIIIASMPPIHEFPAFPPLLQFFLGKLMAMISAMTVDVAKKYPHVFFMSKKILLKEWIHKVPEGTGPQDFFSDGVHPSALTYSLWGQEIAEYAIIHNLVASQTVVN